MKPYGQKHQKSKFRYKCGHDECIVCTTSGWETFKSRERHNTEEIDDFLTSDEISSLDELEYTIKIRQIDDDLFEGSSNVLDIKAVSCDPEEVLGNFYHEFIHN